MTAADRKKVALLVRTSNEWSRQVLMGVAQFAQENGGWEFTHPPANDIGEVFLPNEWQGDGIICRLSSDSLREQILNSNTPAINVSWLGHHQAKIVKVVSDEDACGKSLSEYFLERQFLNFGFIGPPHWKNYGDAIAASICESLATKNLQLSRFQYPPRDQLAELFKESMRKWLSNIVKPAALIVWTSQLGRDVLSVCLELGFSIPDQVSIVCIEHDDLASSLSPIPLSNLDQDAWRVGYTAANTLDKIMKGLESPVRPISVPPISIVQRRSSEASAVDDPVVREAYRFIHECVTRGLNVDDVVREIGVSRRTLEKKFQETFDLSPAQVIRRARLLVVKRLLRETTLTVPQVAERSGFSHAEVLIRSFKKETGLTPTQFRSSSL